MNKFKIKSYSDCLKLDQEHPRLNKLEHKTYFVRHGDGRYGIRLFGTEIITYYPGKIVLNSGGRHTFITCDRINRYSPLRIYGINRFPQLNWRVYHYEFPFGPVSPFADGITYYPVFNYFDPRTTE